jgi:pilus assembly protein CpaB
MQRHRVLVAFGIAWLTALILSWAVYKKTAAPEKRQVVQVIAAAADLPIGKRVAKSDVKLVTVDQKNLPGGVNYKLEDVVDRALTSPVISNELVLDGKLSPKGGGEGLTAQITPGMRAVSVQVNEITGVSGFVQPGTRVDVLFSRIFSNGDAAATTILQNVKVIAYGTKLDPQAKVDAREAARTTTVATLLVNESQAAKLALAIQRGKIQLVLRNPLDSEISDDVYPVVSADLGLPEPVKPAPPRPVVVAPPPPDKDKNKDKNKPRSGPNAVEQVIAAPNEGETVIHVYRGSKVSEDVFQK